MFHIPVARRWHGQNLVTMKLGVLWDFFSSPRCPNHLQFAGSQNERPDVPQNFLLLPSDSFLIRAAAEEDLKLSWFLVFRKISQTFIFFVSSPACSIDFNCYAQLLEKTNSLVFYFYLRWRNFSIVFLLLKKMGFLQTFESNVSFFTRSYSELGLVLVIRWERNKDFPKKSSERADLCFFLLKSRRFSKLNMCLRSILFAKKTLGHVDFGSDNAAKTFLLKLRQFFLKFRNNFSFQSNYGWAPFVFWVKFVPWIVLPGTTFTCLTSLLQKNGTVKIWLLWNWPFSGTFFPLPVVKLT